MSRNIELKANVSLLISCIEDNDTVKANYKVYEANSKEYKIKAGKKVYEKEMREYIFVNAKPLPGAKKYGQTINQKAFGMVNCQSLQVKWCHSGTPQQIQAINNAIHNGIVAYLMLGKKLE